MKRFWAKVDVKDEDECWLWLGGVTYRGYGHSRLNGRQMGAHRAAWILTFGPIPDGLLVLHKCDVPKCCNPKHLFLGTHRDNLVDAQQKGRFPIQGKIRCSIENCTRPLRSKGLCGLHYERQRSNRQPQRVAQHGTRSKYSAGCRCEPCRAANAAHQRELYRRRKSA
jgi:hypothetical protein